ncbi:hypothetical protein GCM10011505_06820 [Tistrella bauzanensis]|uniref:Flagellum-specific ATP synthase n=1 Tax=Tistrella bauzanensis TaxID=657419 RepID=A0ABQ1I8U1_9PROT|nr:hypothetical protein GCM10011505_06820 [Tistrella bauzanensis]
MGGVAQPVGEITDLPLERGQILVQAIGGCPVVGHVTLRNLWRPRRDRRGSTPITGGRAICSKAIAGRSAAGAAMWPGNKCRIKGLTTGPCRWR